MITLIKHCISVCLKSIFHVEVSIKYQITHAHIFLAIYGSQNQKISGTYFDATSMTLITMIPA